MTTAPTASASECAAVLAVLREADGAVKRRWISLQTSLSDRVVRAALNALVLDGHPIVPDRAEGGYELTNSSAKIRAELSRLRSHGTEILKRANALETQNIGVSGELFA